MPEQDIVVIATRTHADGRVVKILERRANYPLVVLEVYGSDGLLEQAAVSASELTAKAYVGDWLERLGHDCFKEHCPDWQTG
jgi:hypothetical protein